MEGLSNRNSLLQQAAAGEVDRALLHVVHPAQALAAAVGRAGIRVVRDNARHLCALAQQAVHAEELAAAARRVVARNLGLR